MLTSNLLKKSNKLVIIFCICLNPILWYDSFFESRKNRFFAYPSFSSDEYHYIARAKQVWNGNSVTSISRDSYNDGIQSIVENIFFSIGRIFQSSNSLFYMFFIAIAVISSIAAVTSFFFLVSKLTKTNNKIGNQIIILIFLLIMIWVESYKIETNPTNTGFERWPTPSLHYLIINLLFIILLNSSYSYKDTISLVALLSSSVYLYFYTWQITLTISCLFLILNLVRKKSKNVGILSTSIIISLVIGIPYYRNLLQTRENRDNLSNIFFERQMGLINSNSFNSSKLLVIGCLILLLVLKVRQKFTLSFQLITGCIVLAGIIVLNQNLLTGYVIQPGHYYWYFIAPYIYLVSIIVIIELISSRILKFTVIPLALILLFSYFNLANNTKNYVPEDEYNRLGTDILTSLPRNTYSLNNNIDTFLSINANNSPALIQWMIYYPNSLGTATENCMIQTLWHVHSLEKNHFSMVMRENELCKTIEKTLGYNYLFSQIDQWRLNPSDKFSKWAESNEVSAILAAGSLSEVQTLLLKDQWPKRFSRNGLSVYSKIEL